MNARELCLPGVLASILVVLVAAIAFVQVVLVSTIGIACRWLDIVLLPM